MHACLPPRTVCDDVIPEGGENWGSSHLLFFSLRFTFVSSFQRKPVRFFPWWWDTQNMLFLPNVIVVRKMWSSKPPKMLLLPRRDTKKTRRADNLLTSSQINSQASPMWLPLSRWSLGDIEEVMSSGLCLHLRAEMKLHRHVLSAVILSFIYTLSCFDFWDFASVSLLIPSEEDFWKKATHF